MKQFNLLPVALLLAVRYISSKRRDRFVSFMAFSSMTGVALGIVALVVVLSIMNGFHTELRERILSLTPHLVLSDHDNKLKDWQDWIEQVKTVDGIQAVSPIIQKQGLISGTREVKGINVLGIDPSHDEKVSRLQSIMVEGNTTDLQVGGWGIILGREVVDSLSLKVGDKIKIIAPQSKIGPMGFVPRIKSFTLVGVFEAGMYEYDSGLAVVHLRDAQILFQMKEHISGLQLQTEDMFDLWPVKKSIAETMKQPVYVIDWRQHHTNLFSAIALEKKMMFVVLTLMIGIAIFNIVTSMVMMVNDKQSDIAILRTLGLKTRNIRYLFMVQGVIIGSIGTTLGVIFGVILALNVENIVPWLENLFDIHFFPADIFYISKIPSELQIADILYVSLMAFTLTVIATLYPAHKAARLSPAEALRYE